MLNKINTILSLSYKDREGNKYSTNDILLKYINDDNIYVTFTDINKLGINPKYDFDTPLGIYCYPIKEAYRYYKLGKNNKQTFIETIPLVNNRKYIIIFKTKNKNTIIDSNYTKERFSRDFDLLKKEYYLKNKDLFDNFHLKIKNNNIPYLNIIENNYSSQLYFLTYFLSKRDFIKWNKIFRFLGYDAFVDPGYSIIHKNEPCQAVFFSIKNIEIIGSYNNKTNKIIKKSTNYKKVNIIDKGVKEEFFINCDINLNNSENNVSFLSDSKIKKSTLNINNEKSRIYNCNINDSTVKNIGSILNSKIFNTIINGGLIEGTVLDSCSIDKGKLKNNKCYKTTIGNSIINNSKSYFSECQIYTTKINNCSKINFEIVNSNEIYINNCDEIIVSKSEINNTQFNNIKFVIVSESDIKDIQFNKTNVLVFLSDSVENENSFGTTFNNVLFNGINLSNIKNYKQLENVELYFWDNSSDKKIKLKDIKNYNNKNFLSIFNIFLKNNYPNILEIINNK